MNPLIPMLAVTGNPTNRQLAALLESYHAVGIDTVMLYPRSGLEVEYLSEDFRRICTDILRNAQRLGMHLWLYDEFNWPSGSCNNTVIRQNPAFAARRFVCENGTVRVETMHAGDAEMVMEPFDSDMLNPAAVRCFIHLTHETYARWFGEYFGNVITGIFTDEPSFIYTANREGMFPYYDGVCEAYAAACGGDLMTDMAAYMRGEQTPSFPGVFRTLVSERFRSAYIAQIGDWCRAHHLQLTGHTLEDESPLTATRVTGNWFDFMQHVDVPGVDEIPTRFGTNDDMLFSMIENLRFGGKSAAMAELFALGPCSMSFARRKQMLWYAAAHGVNTYFIAISHFDAKGNVRKPDFFDNFNLHCPDFAGVRLLAAEAARAAAFADKRVRCTVGVRCPYTAYLAALGKRQDGAVAATFAALIEGLTAAQSDWRMLREDEDAPDCRYLLTADANGVTEQHSGERYSVDAAVAAVTAARDTLVTDKNGVLLPVLVKTYTDGSVAVIDRTNTACGQRQCFLHCGGKVVPFMLENYGVQIFDGGIHVPAVPEETVTPLEGYTVQYSGASLLRCVFLQQPTFDVTVTAPMTVQLHRRIYPETTGTVSLDGSAVAFTAPCTALTGCFSPLYRTATVTLSPGVHRLETTLTDYPYLPALLIGGEFDADGATLSPRDMARPCRFFGSIRVSAETTFSPADTALIMADCGLYVTAAVDGEEIGACMCAPYRFAIPPRFLGKAATVTFTFFGTLAPLFGDMTALRAAGQFRPSWQFVPTGAPEVLDIEKLHIGRASR